MKNKVASHIFVASLALLLMANAFANISSATHQRTTTSTTTTSTGTGFAETFSLQNGVVVNDAQQTSDGGYILAGSVDYVSSQTHALLMKLDSSGNIRWSENYGTNLKNTGTGTESAIAVRQTSDGGYIFAGSLATQANFGTPCSASCSWVVRTDSSGNLQWQKTFSGASTGGASDIEPASDGGYIVTGSSSNSNGIGYAWVVKLDSNGNTQWERQIGCSATGSSGCDAGASFVQQTSDGGYVVTGFGGTYPSYLSTGLVIKLSSTGAVQWQNTYGPMGINPSIQQTRDGGYIVTSGEANTDGFAGWTDLAALKLDSNGNIQWQKQYQDSFTHCVLMGDGCDYVPNSTDGLSVRQTSDGGYIFAGYFGTYAGYNQGWLLRTDSSGNVQWQKSYSFAQEFLTVRQTSDGGFVSAGYGGQVMKVDANGNISSCSAIQNTAATIVSSLITTTALSLPAASLSSSVTVSAAAGPVSVTSTKKC